jgi:hypothetical protein
MTLAEGSNIVMMVSPDATGAVSLYTYTDTLSTTIPVQTGPADGAINTEPNAVVLMWEAATGATAYEYQIESRADFAVSNAATALPTAVNAPLTSQRVTGLIAGRTYYWHVRVAAPVIGPWSQSFSFETQLVQADPNSPDIVSPSVGGTGPGGYNAPLNPTFQWTNVPRATGYEFQLAIDPLMEELIIDFSGDKPLGNTTAYKLTAYTLDYSTTYYWRVRAVSATSETDWSVIVAFTTMAEPTETTSTAPPPSTSIVVTQPPATSIVVTQPPATTVTMEAPVTEEISPAYIWAIIIIGAVLVIAVIVLIVRTRRNV